MPGTKDFEEQVPIYLFHQGNNARSYEYMGAQGIIFTIYGDENDPIKSIVNDHKKCINSLNNKDEIKKSLIKLLNMKDFKTLPDENYEWDEITKRLNKILR